MFEYDHVVKHQILAFAIDDLKRSCAEIVADFDATTLEDRRKIRRLFDN